MQISIFKICLILLINLLGNEMWKFVISTEMSDSEWSGEISKYWKNCISQLLQ